MSAALFFIWFFAALVWTVNALRKPVPPGGGFPPLWLPGMIVSELAPLLFVFRILVAAGFFALGALDRGIGIAALVLFTLSQLGLLALIVRSIRSSNETGFPEPVRTLFSLREALPAGVGVRRGVHYWDGLTLDVYCREDVSGAPGLVYLHPGSWMRGRPGRQARAMIHRLADRGWVVLDIRYPLSPAATFPEHLIGVKQAIAWARAQKHEIGLDPERVAISGGSSGAHLAALAALTGGRKDLQPGFEDADATVMGCVAFYGIYDLLVRNPTRYDWPFVAKYVMKATAVEHPDLYELGSPIDQAHEGAPPFLLVHGSHDSIVLSAESAHFAQALEAEGVDVTFHEVHGAQHGFDAITSLRSRAVARMCVDWLEDLVAVS